MIDYEKCLTEIAPCQKFDIEDYLKNVSSLESMKVVLDALAKDMRISLQDETDNDSKHWHDDVQHLIDLNLGLKSLLRSLSSTCHGVHLMKVVLIVSFLHITS